MLRTYILMASIIALLVPAVASAQTPQIIPEFNALCWHKDDCIKARKLLAPAASTDGWKDHEPECPGADWGKCLPAGETVTSISFGGRREFRDIGDFLKYMYQYALTIAGIVAAVVIIISGVQWVTSGGNAQMIEDAKKRIVGAVVGMIIAYMSYVILNTINPALVNLRLPNVWMLKPQAIVPEYCSQLSDTVKNEVNFALAAPAGDQKKDLSDPVGVTFDLSFNPDAGKAPDVAGATAADKTAPADKPAAEAGKTNPDAATGGTETNAPGDTATKDQTTDQSTGANTTDNTAASGDAAADQTKTGTAFDTSKEATDCHDAGGTWNTISKACTKPQSTGAGTGSKKSAGGPASFPCGARFYVKDSGKNSCRGDFCSKNSVCVYDDTAKKYGCREGNIFATVTHNSLAKQVLPDWATREWNDPAVKIVTNLYMVCADTSEYDFSSTARAVLIGESSSEIRAVVQQLGITPTKLPDNKTETFTVKLENGKIDTAVSNCAQAKGSFKGFVLGLGMNQSYNTSNQLHFVGSNGEDLGDRDFFSRYWDKIPSLYFLPAEQLKKGLQLRIDATRILDIFNLFGESQPKDQQYYFTKFGITRTSDYNIFQ